MKNLREVRPPSSDRAFRVQNVPPKKLSHVAKAIRQFMPFSDAEDIIHGYRRSPTDEEALIADFMFCDLDEPPCVQDSTFQETFDQVVKLWQPPKKYRPVHFCDLRYYPWTLSTSVEAPYSTSQDARNEVERLFALGEIPNRRMSFGNLYNYTFVKNRRLVHEIKEGRGKGDKFFSWNTAHARSHIVRVDEPSKVRMVHGVPKLFLQVEAMLLWPYFNYLRKGLTPILWGYEMMEGGMLRICDDLIRHTNYDVFMAIDWKQFDKRVSFKLIDIVHDCWSTFMTYDSGYMPSLDYPTSVVKEWRCSNLWKWMNAAAKFTPIRLPNGQEFKRRHSTLASGMLQTQVLDSWINTIMTLTCLKELKFDIEDLYIKVLGDDSVIASRMPPGLRRDDILPRLAEIAARRFGAIVNTEKSQILPSVEGIHILGYDCHSCLPRRNSNKLLAQLLYPERYAPFEVLKARCVGIAMAGCGLDVNVYKVCKDVFEYCSSRTEKPADTVGIPWKSYIDMIRPVDYDVFPTRNELLAKLAFPSGVNPDLNEKFWPSWFFSEEY